MVKTFFHKRLTDPTNLRRRLMSPHEPTAIPSDGIKFEQAEPRYVIFCRGRGIWLGDGHWSYGNPAGRTTAPTYASKTDAIRAMNDDSPIKHPNTVEYRQLPPITKSQDKGFVTMEQLANVGLPVWEPNKDTDPSPTQTKQNTSGH